MSQQYPGGFITRANVDPTSSLGSIPAPGVWTLDQVLQYKQAGVWPSPALNAIEDVFSTYLYAGTAATQTITNGIDLASNGGLIVTKNRSGTDAMQWTSNATGLAASLESTSTSTGVSVVAFNFNTNGYTINTTNSRWNSVGANYANWTFRKQAKFFDVVTYTGNGSNRTIAHNLGSVPGTIIIKRTDTTGAWAVYHRSLANTEYLVLNTTAAKATGATYWNSTTPTSTVFSLGTAVDVNANAGTYVAYLFAHDAGGFGPNNTDNVISCGSFTGTSSAAINLGYEPQWLLFKRTDLTDNWRLVDNMRGWPVSGNPQEVCPNLAQAETSNGGVNTTSTGFTTVLGTGGTYVYIAIRRGPMRPPTTGTSVFAVNFGSDVTTYTTNFPLDMGWDNQTTGNAANTVVGARLLGQGSVSTASTAAEVTAYIPSTFWQSNSNYRFNAFGADCATYAFRRAPGFFDVVCYTGNGVAGRTVSHNLSVTPEMIIIKKRNSVDGWFVCNANYTNKNTYYQRLNTTAAQADYGGNLVYNWGSTTFALDSANVNDNTNTYVAYLFATIAGVSKVGSYTGTGALQTINCGFSSGARFVLIKRIDTTGDWWTYDSARGITSGNDPYFFLNTTAAQNTSTNYVDTTSVGFQVTAAAPAGLNASGGTYIFLAIA